MKIEEIILPSSFLQLILDKNQIKTRLNVFSECSDLEGQNTMVKLGIIISFWMTSETTWNYCHYLPLDIYSTNPIELVLNNMFLGDFRGLNYLSLTLRCQNIKCSRWSPFALTRWSMELLHTTITYLSLILMFIWNQILQSCITTK